MLIISLVIIFCESFVLLVDGTATHWTYTDEYPPSKWHESFPLCGGKSQSPINIDVSKVKLDNTLTDFDLSDLSKIEGINMKLENNQGHTVEVVVSGSPQFISGGSLPGKYKLAQFHFHWGAVDQRGSEHSINNRMHPGEMHAVFFSDRFSSLEDAMNNTNGLAVLGSFFKVGKHNSNFDHLQNHFANISHSNMETEIETFSIRSLLPKSVKGYFRYHGSLTTPPCSESVIWTIFHDEIELSEEQLNKFRHIKANHLGEPDVDLKDDFRPFQPLNGRTVTSSQTAENEIGSAEKVRCTLTLLLLTVVVMFVL